ncbi:MAG: hypothetical protein Unbinned3696contig1008_3 [Prokaryotic dsDNA virus sp.]|nr:MAG: hypothetical protein Unbinned3696contig1008_3 [Prokaryotic dsDNA virus sp.]
MLKGLWALMTGLRGHAETERKREAEYAAFEQARRVAEATLEAEGFRVWLASVGDCQRRDLVEFATIHSEHRWTIDPRDQDPLLNANGLYWRPVEYAEFDELPPKRAISHSLH